MATLYLKYYDTAKAGAPGDQHRMEHRIGLELLSYGLQDLFQISIPADEISDHIQTEKLGKPFLDEYPDIHFNISNCDGLVACALDKDPIGVDAEKTRRCPESVFRRLFTDEERAFFDDMAKTEELRVEWFLRFWTLKESYIKQNGAGLTMPLSSFSFTFDLSCDPMKIICSEPGFCFSQYQLESGHILSVCTVSKPDSPKLVFPFHQSEGAH